MPSAEAVEETETALSVGVNEPALSLGAVIGAAVISALFAAHSGADGGVAGAGYLWSCVGAPGGALLGLLFRGDGPGPATPDRRSHHQQGVTSGTRVHEAGHAVNVIPERARAGYEARAPAAGAELELAPYGHDFAELRQDPMLTSAYPRAARALGREPVPRHGELTASTDMGNVSHAVPSLHPCIGHDTGGALRHTEGFTRYGSSPGADRAVLDGAAVPAHAAAELATGPGRRTSYLQRVARRDGEP
ncbi:hypothetical protein ABZX76_29380, partial [Streptomyces sp. NPDC004042]